MEEPLLLLPVIRQALLDTPAGKELADSLSFKIKRIVEEAKLSPSTLSRDERMEMFETQCEKKAEGEAEGEEIRKQAAEIAALVLPRKI